MTDAQWLAAVAAHNADGVRDWSGDAPTGGASELANVMQRQATDEPARFAVLASKLPDQTHPAYFDAILQGVTESTIRIAIEPFVELIRRCNRLPEQPCARSMVRAISAYKDDPLPDEIVDLVVWCAVDHPDPDSDEWRSAPGESQPLYGGDPFTAGLNSVRGGAAYALADLVLADLARMNRLSTELERLVSERLISVRSCVARILGALLSQDRDLAIGLFVRLCQADDDALLGTPYVEQFLYFAAGTHFDVLRPIIDQMLESENAAAATAGARQASLASLTVEGARPLAVRCLEGTENQREGAAQIFSANLKIAAFRATCEQALIRLFDDPSEKVRSKAASCFEGLGGKEFGEFVGLAERFVASAAYEINSFPLIHAMETTTSDASGIICIAADKFLSLAGTAAGDFSTSAAGDSYHFSQLVTRAYGQTSSDAVRSRCLDILDRMMALQAYGVTEALDAFER